MIIVQFKNKLTGSFFFWNTEIWEPQESFYISIIAIFRIKLKK